MVNFRDGSVMAQLGQPDMRTPIAYGLGYPERLGFDIEPLPFTSLDGLTFEQANFERFPALALAQQAMAESGTMPAILNAANEIAVEKFLDKQLPFLAITDVIKTVLNQLEVSKASDIETILEADKQARSAALAFIERNH